MFSNSQSCFLILLVLLCSHGHSKLMIPFGEEARRDSVKDDSLSSVDDGHLKIDLNTPFVINNEQFLSVYINVNGILTFSEPCNTFGLGEISGPFIAPFWGDVDMSGRVSKGNTMYYRVSERAQDLEWVRSAIEEGVNPNIQWTPKTVVVVTWYNVGHFMSQTSELNTFQVIMATDGIESLAFLNYPENGLNWWISEQGQTSTVGFRTQNTEFLLRDSTPQQILAAANSTNTRSLNRFVFKLDGYRPLLTKISYTSPPCFFGGSKISISGHGFIMSDTLKCKLTSLYRTVEVPATYISFDEVSCELPVWDSSQILNISVANDGSHFSEPIDFMLTDCILSYFPIKTCVGEGTFTVESFPTPWNSQHQYRCHFGNISTPANIENEILTCSLPDLKSSDTVGLRVSLGEGDNRVQSRLFGKLQVYECGFVFNKLQQCTKRTIGVFWEEGKSLAGRETKDLTAVITYPSGFNKVVSFVGKFLEIEVPEDGIYNLIVAGITTWFEIKC